MPRPLSSATRASIITMKNEGISDRGISETLGISRSVVFKIFVAYEEEQRLKMEEQIAREEKAKKAEEAAAREAARMAEIENTVFGRTVASLRKKGLNIFEAEYQATIYMTNRRLRRSE